MKHTPGPYEHGYNNDQVIYSGDKRIATVECSNKDWKANVKLLAAAPDMLDAIKFALGRLNTGKMYDAHMHSSQDLCINDAISLLSDAINKAENK